MIKSFNFNNMVRNHSNCELVCFDIIKHWFENINILKNINTQELYMSEFLCYLNNNNIKVTM